MDKITWKLLKQFYKTESLRFDRGLAFNEFHFLLINGYIEIIFSNERDSDGAQLPTDNCKITKKGNIYYEERRAKFYYRLLIAVAGIITALSTTAALFK